MALRPWNVLELCAGAGGSASVSNSPCPERVVSLTWRGKQRPPRSWSTAWKRTTWLRRLSGLTLPPSTLARGVDAFIASLPEIHAKETASPESGLASSTIASSSTRFSASSMSAGLSVSSERTCRGTRTANSPPSWGHWSEWAIALNAEYLARAKPGTVTDESDCSSWPTPSAQQFEADDLDRLLDRQAAQAEKNGNNGFGMTLANEVQIWSRQWRTPNAMMAMHGPMDPEYRARKGQTVSLDDQASTWATPTAWMTKGGGDALTRADGKSRLDMLDWQAEAWSRSSCPDPTIPLGEISSTDGRNSLPQSTKSRLNVFFTEALMRWPIGWTDFGCSETGSTQWRQDMRGYLWMLVTARIGSERQGALL